jgi:hypothetical protein
MFSSYFVAGRGWEFFAQQYANIFGSQLLDLERALSVIRHDWHSRHQDAKRCHIVLMIDEVVALIDRIAKANPDSPRIDLMEETLVTVCQLLPDVGLTPEKDDKPLDLVITTLDGISPQIVRTKSNRAVHMHSLGYMNEAEVEQYVTSLPIQSPAHHSHFLNVAVCLSFAIDLPFPFPFPIHYFLLVVDM